MFKRDSLTRFFVLGFFNQTVLSAPIRDVSGPFRILANFHEVIGLPGED